MGGVQTMSEHRHALLMGIRALRERAAGRLEIAANRLIDGHSHWTPSHSDEVEKLAALASEDMAAAKVLTGMIPKGD